jgi:serine/threonine protein kinase
MAGAAMPEPLVLGAGIEPIPGYRLVRLLGRGGFGEVWEASAPGDFHVALKFIRLDSNAAGVEQRSLDVIRHIRHPHLLDVQFATRVADCLVIAMPLCDESLMDRLRVSPHGLPRGKLFVYMKELARAVDYLNEPNHRASDGKLVGVQHRDIKPHNIFLVGGSARLADFGLAKIQAATSVSHTGSMSPHYVAPEVVEGRVSQRSDQYALAITYYQLRTGKLPFEGESVLQVIYAHIHGEPDLLALPEHERPVVARALAKRPEDRWPSCRAFVRALVASGSTSAVAPGAPPRTQPVAGGATRLPETEMAPPIAPTQLEDRSPTRVDVATATTIPRHGGMRRLGLAALGALLMILAALMIIPRLRRPSDAAPSETTPLATTIPVKGRDKNSVAEGRPPKDTPLETVQRPSSDRADVARATASSPPATPAPPIANPPETASTPPGTFDEVNRLLNEVNRLLNAGQWVDAKTPLDQALSLGTAAQQSRRLKFLRAWYDGDRLTPVPYENLLDLTPVRYGGKWYIAAIGAGANNLGVDLFDVEKAAGSPKVTAPRKVQTVSIGFPLLLLTSLGRDGSFAVSNEHSIKGIDGKGTELIDMWSDIFRMVFPDGEIPPYTTKISLGRFAYDRENFVMLFENLAQTPPGDKDTFRLLSLEVKPTQALKPARRVQFSHPRNAGVAGIGFFPALRTYVIVHSDGSLTQAVYNGSLTQAVYSVKAPFSTDPYMISRSARLGSDVFFAHAFDTAHNMVVLSFGTKAVIYDVRKGVVEPSEFPHASPVSAVALGVGGDLLATACQDRSVRIFDLRTKELLVEYNVPGFVFRLAFGPDDQYLVAGVADQGRSRGGPEGIQYLPAAVGDQEPGSKIYLWPLPGPPGGEGR